MFYNLGSLTVVREVAFELATAAAEPRIVAGIHVMHGA